ncbi:MAG: GTP 3',8-cyclase MoaA [Deltaproteobacteria bacterium]|nr:GTP 3',8-cyclase MoaA [Deltaproteobacteria bacterium]
MKQLIDPYNRKIDYVRLSVTDKCNFQCFYCRPSLFKQEFVPDHSYLTVADIEKLFIVLGRLGIRKVKLTGGEPLLRKDIVDIVRVLRDNSYIQDISLITNGFFLEKKAFDLKEAGLHRVNVSLDSLNEKSFQKITQTLSLERVKKGIVKAYDVGLEPIKINAVLVKGMNDEELFDFVRFSIHYPFIVRFIEFMPTGFTQAEHQVYYFSNHEALLRIKEKFSLTPKIQKEQTGPSSYFKVDGGKGEIGFISPLSHNFCDKCNRIRITAKGDLKLCLFSQEDRNLLSILRSSHWEKKLEETLIENLRLKPKHHDLGKGQIGNVQSFVNIGG